MPKIIDDKEIFDAIIGVITDLGYFGATTKLMAEAADISEVTLFRKFGSKQELVSQTVSYVLSRSNLASSLQYTGNIHEDLVRFVRTYETAVSKRGDFVSSLVIEVYRNPELRDLLTKPIGVFKQLAAIFVRYQQEDKIREEPPLMTVASLLGPLMYKNLMSKIIGQQDSFYQKSEEYVSNFLQGRQFQTS